MLAGGSKNTRSLGNKRADKYDVDKCKVTHTTKSTLTTCVPRRAPDQLLLPGEELSEGMWEFSGNVSSMASCSQKGESDVSDD